MKKTIITWLISGVEASHILIYTALSILKGFVISCAKVNLIGVPYQWLWDRKRKRDQLQEE